MKTPKGYLFHYFNDKYHIEKGENCQGVTICGALIRYDRGNAHQIQTNVDGRSCCLACRQQVKRRRLHENY